MGFIKVASLSDFWEGERRIVRVGAYEILMIHSKAGVHAYENRCPHQGSPLDRAKIVKGVLICPRHEWEYDLETGQGINPCGVKLNAFPVKMIADEVWIETENAP